MKFSFFSCSSSFAVTCIEFLVLEMVEFKSIR